MPFASSTAPRPSASSNTPSDNLPRRTLAKNHLERPEQDGLTRTGLAGNHIEPAVEFDLKLLDEGIVSDVEGPEHAIRYSV